ncbi:hypothetical protein NPIL_423021 [Nephila pilipes]|uniref:Uncharacterized protein n=1 Tax=Nephila pilipes TaxID=299642 RepID=A0A8X6IQ33_NEPPI|nr:hypothetical protein NPIL_423021 [Nephila pilipes]
MKEKPWINDILNLPDCPRSISVAVFRLTNGHDCLYAHRCRYRIVNSLAYQLYCSGMAMNANRFHVCSALTKSCIYSRFCEARHSLDNFIS